MTKFKTFEDFMKECIFHRDSITLPDTRTFEKFPYITSKGFDFMQLRERLLEIFNNEFKE